MLLLVLQKMEMKKFVLSPSYYFSNNSNGHIILLGLFLDGNIHYSLKNIMINGVLRLPSYFSGNWVSKFDVNSSGYLNDSYHSYVTYSKEVHLNFTKIIKNYVHIAVQLVEKSPSYIDLERDKPNYIMNWGPGYGQIWTSISTSNQGVNYFYKI